MALQQRAKELVTRHAAAGADNKDVELGMLAQFAGAEPRDEPLVEFQLRRYGIMV